jgi:hypothetical protein
VSGIVTDFGGLPYHRHNATSDDTLSHVLFHDVTADDGVLRSGTTSGTSTHTAVAEGDPGFVDATRAAAAARDLRLDSGSAAIDAGDPAILDADGSTSDMGAYGGPGAW